MDWHMRPARDHGLSLAEGLRSAGREPGLGSAAAHWTCTALIRGYMRLFHRLAVHGAEHLPAEVPFVLVANHGSHLDALALLAALPRRLSQRCYSLAAGEMFFASPGRAGFAALALNALPVWRKRTSPADLAFLRERLAADRIGFILFPEGTRSRTGAMARFRPGIGAMVAGSAVPVVPCFLHGVHRAWPPGRRLPRPGRVRVVIGPALRFDGVADDRTGWMDVAQCCEAAVQALDTDFRTAS